MMQIEFLGTGTSTGVPQINCPCAVCHSTDARDKRLRTSALITVEGKHILIDCSADFRQQALRANITQLDALLITHSHYDHCGGLDDMRPFCIDKPFPVYAEPSVITEIKNHLPYCFMPNPIPGVPQFDMRPIAPFEPFVTGGIEILPLRVMHHKLPIVGFRIGNMAYITDCLTLPDETIAQIKGIDTLVINALRIEPHLSHLSLDEALCLIERIAPRQAYLTHMSHGIGFHAEVTQQLPPHVTMAYDGLIINV